MDIRLTPDAIQFVEGLVASGEYASTDEAIADGVRLLMNRQELRADIRKGCAELDSGQGISGDEVFAELRERANKLMESPE